MDQAAQVNDAEGHDRKERKQEGQLQQ